jgi:hypothetical protein
MSVQPSFCPPGMSRLSLDEFSRSLLFENFRKSDEKCKYYWNLRRLMSTLHEGLRAFMIIFYWILIRMRNYSDKRNSEHTFCFQKKYFFEICAVYEIMWKNTVAPKTAMDDNITRSRRSERCVLDNKGYKQKFRICNIYCNSSSKIFMRKRLIVTLPN